MSTRPETGCSPRSTVPRARSGALQAIMGAVGDLGFEIRAGCHTGEIELAGEDVHGIAVHIGARVAALAGPSEVLVSSTVKDLVAGSGLVVRRRRRARAEGRPRHAGTSTGW